MRKKVILPPVIDYLEKINRVYERFFTFRTVYQFILKLDFSSEMDTLTNFCLICKNIRIHLIVVFIVLNLIVILHHDNETQHLGQTNITILKEN